MSTTLSAVEASFPESTRFGSKCVPLELRVDTRELESELRAKTVPVFIHASPQSHPFASSGLKRGCPMAVKELVAVEKSDAPSNIRNDATAYSTGLRTQVFRV